MESLLKKHIDEEELLYSSYKYKTGEILPILQTIRNEHSIILEKLEKAKKTKDIDDFHSFLIRHKNVEERLLYPELDKALSEKQKEDVYWNIR